MSRWTAGVKARQDKQAERFARYCELRDQGILPADAAREIGLAPSPTGQRYELAYRKIRGLPGAELTNLHPDPRDGLRRQPDMSLDSDQLAQFRGCEPGNDCYFDCCQVAREDITEGREAYPGELGEAGVWAAAQTWS